MKTYKQFTIAAEPFDVDTISGMLWQLELDGINEYDDYLTVFANQNKSVTYSSIDEVMQQLVSQNLITSYQIKEETLEDKNWNEEFEKNSKVVEITDKVVIKPSFKEYFAKPGQIIITIDPKMSFGTGDHATTKQIVKLLEKNVKGGETVLDVGSGTAILAIASVLLGAKNAIGIDNDEWCQLNGNENVLANNLQDKIDIRLGKINDITEIGFDIIVANINKHILIDIADELLKRIKKTGTLILSGLLNTDEPEIVELYTSKGLKIIEKSEMNEWIALLFSR